MGWLKETIPEDMALLLKGGNFCPIPTVSGWTAIVVGSGSSAQQVTRNSVWTGSTPNSSALLYSAAYGLSGGAANFQKLDFAKKLYFMFSIARQVSDAQVIARVQLKVPTGVGQPPALGALVDQGIGLRIDNHAVKGESHGSSLGVVDLDTTLTDNTEYRIAIILQPGVSVRWYVNEVLKGAQSTASAVPASAPALYPPYFVHSINNGAAGGVEPYSSLILPRLWQER